MRGFFVTGTDTGVGKTVVSAALMQHLRRLCSVLYWKPVATGFPQDDDEAEVRRLGSCDDDELHRFGVRFREPLSPHRAAALEAKRISLSDLGTMREHGDPRRLWIVEGAGGVRVPLNEEQLMTDLMLMLALPVIIAARSTLGTINHTLLTLEALRHRAIDIAGVVMVGPPDVENRRAIERYGKTEVLGEMPHFDPLDSDLIAAWANESLDREARLQKYVTRWKIAGEIA